MLIPCCKFFLVWLNLAIILLLWSLLAFQQSRYSNIYGWVRASLRWRVQNWWKIAIGTPQNQMSSRCFYPSWWLCLFRTRQYQSKIWVYNFLCLKELTLEFSQVLAAVYGPHEPSPNMRNQVGVYGSITYRRAWKGTTLVPCANCMSSPCGPSARFALPHAYTVLMIIIAFG